MTKTNALQAALDQNGSRKTPSAKAGAGKGAEPLPETAAIPQPVPKPSSRDGMVHISAWLDPAYQTSLRLIHAKTGRKKQELMAEALNDFFAKHDVPQIRED